MLLLEDVIRSPSNDAWMIHDEDCHFSHSFNKRWRIIIRKPPDSIEHFGSGPWGPDCRGCMILVLLSVTKASKLSLDMKNRYRTIKLEEEFLTKIFRFCFSSSCKFWLDTRGVHLSTLYELTCSRFNLPDNEAFLSCSSTTLRFTTIMTL